MTTMPPATLGPVTGAGAPPPVDPRTDLTGLRSDRGSGAAKRRRTVWLVLVAVVLGALAMLAVVMFERTSAVPLDPANPGANGGEALASVLRDHRIRLTVQHDPSAVTVGADQTLVVTGTSALGVDQLRSLWARARGAHRVVLVGPSGAQVSALLPDAISSKAGVGPLDAAGCGVAWAQGLTISSADQTFKDFDSSRTHSTACFTDPSGAGALLVVPPAATPQLVLVGTSAALTNAQLAQQDNAALAIRALGASPQLVWLSPTGAGPAATAGETSPKWPPWLGPGILLTLATLVLLALWRGRRFGRLVTEPLPVVVKAGETTRSRGELYRRARDLPRTAAVLRRASCARLRTTLAVPPGAPTGLLVERVAAATGRPEADLHALLLGAPPVSETDLTTLARDLRALERQVHP